MSEQSITKQYQEDTNRYYGGEQDPLKFAPVVKDKDVAHEVALGVQRGLDNIHDEDITASALRGQLRYRMQGEGSTGDLEELKQQALDHAVRMVVVNAELNHARLAPGDFNQDSEKAGAYDMGVGIIVPRQRGSSE